MTDAGRPPIRARFRVAPEDFEVEEVLGFEPDGQGEHLLLWIEKRGANTAWVAGQIARWAGVAPMAVSYAGLKDRHAVARQWLSVHLPRRIAPDGEPAIEGVRILDRRWHGRKLKRGAHRGNRFVITLRDVQGDIEAAERRLARITGEGVPNAFGEQRFGRDAGNLDEARRWLAAERPARLPPAKRGFLLSAARSHLFNAVLDERVRRGDWNRGIPGDCFQLDGRGSWFGPEHEIGEEIVRRVAAGEIHPTGPLWGGGDPPTAAEARALELAVAATEPVLCAGLARFDLRQERRALRLRPADFEWQWQGDDLQAAAHRCACRSNCRAAASPPPSWPRSATPRTPAARRSQVRAGSGKLRRMVRKHPVGQASLPLGGDGGALRPLADRMRPQSLDELVGQEHVAGPGTPLRAALESGKPYSMILWGPPGSGKTTLALLVAKYADAEFHALSAVLGGIAEVRAATAQAQVMFEQGRRSVLFVDEVHRFNKAQQDAFLPHIERGTIVFVGATTENPSFELNSALLSRCRVHVLKPVSAPAMVPALRRALADAERGLGDREWDVDDAVLLKIAEAADGDLRRALTVLEIAAELTGDATRFDATLLTQVLADRGRRFDKGGEQFYDQISALHKSVRSSDPDAAVYWLARMLDGGADPHYLARRLTRMASEDIGLADPRALTLALEAWEAFDRLGPPEGELLLAECAIYLAMAPKSNAAYSAFGAARADVQAHGTLEVPLHLRNAPTKLMKQLGYGKDYQYDHDVEGGVALDQQCLPDALAGARYYEPVARGLEIQIGEKLDALRAARAKAKASE